MNIDIRTLTLTLGILNIILIAAIYLPFLWNKSYRGIGWWLWWAVSMAVGSLFLLLRDYLPGQTVSTLIFLTNTLLLAGQVFLYVGIMRFLGHKENHWLCAMVSIVFILGTAYVLYISNDANARTALLYAAAAVFSFFSARGLFLFAKPTFAASANFVSAVLFVYCCYFALRALAAFTIAPIDSVFTPTLLQAATFLISLITGALCMAGLIIMVFQRANAELREAKEQFELIFNTSPDAVMITGRHNDMIVNVNDGFAALTGFSRDEAIGQSIVELNIWQNPADLPEAFEKLKTKGSCHNIEIVLKTRSGGRIDSAISARIITLQGVPHIISIIRDISELKRMEEEQQRIAKLDALGQFSGGIAREFNELLNSTLGIINLSRMETPPGGDIHGRLERAEQDMLKAKELTGQLLAISSSVGPVRKMVNVRELLRDTAGFALRGSNIKCELHLPADLWATEIDRGQISQVIYNIVTRAREAMLAGGIIEISADNLVFSEDLNNIMGVPLSNGNYVRIFITDQGGGIPVEYMDKIFDPFFIGQDSGLGLAAAFAIARRHGGHLGVKSGPGSGSTFSLYLPASPGTSNPGK
ncbi:MAG: PAS domain S-box protein [Dehalococcoidia bacterium]|nr:MAG: PAS domain S-box protein [Dehalococcoidia bacterium]